MNRKNTSRLVSALLALALCSTALAQSGPLSLVTSYSGQPGMIQNLGVEQPSSYRTGSRVFFSLRGEPGARATVNIESARSHKLVPLSETEPGLYEGFYTVGRYDDFSRGSFSARLEKSGRTSQAWASSEPSRPWRDQGSEERERYGYESNQPYNPYNRGYGGYPSQTCSSCGVVASIQAVDEASAQANAPGIVIGSIVGGLLGNQIGGGHGREASTVLGALGGGYLGNEIGKDQQRQRVWITTVNLESGGTQTFKTTEAPYVKEGQRVQIENNQMFAFPR